ncbi:hypothetical protein KPL74_10620 [Bacillus sp. NP157]|nr:hypothetical protein KPL74_10620 [Bacillus sp. NP157]
MTTDITDRMSDYRASLTSLWNEQFRRRLRSLYHCGPLDQFEQIDKLLFTGLVLEGHAPPGARGDCNVAISVSVPENTECMPGAHVNGYFQWLDTRPIPSIVREELAFEELFDFDRYGELELEFAMRRVKPFDAGELVATHILVPYVACRFSLAMS